MHKYSIVVAGILLAAAQPTLAQLVPAEWDAAGHFNKQLPVQPGKFVEVCDKLPKGATVAWSFEAGTPLDFNIHFHEGKKVLFPARKNQVTKEAGTLVTKLEQDYCWMWTNKSTGEATLRFTLTKG